MLPNYDTNRDPYTSKSMYKGDLSRYTINNNIINNINNN